MDSRYFVICRFPDGTIDYHFTDSREEAKSYAKDHISDREGDGGTATVYEQLQPEPFKSAGFYTEPETSRQLRVYDTARMILPTIRDANGIRHGVAELPAETGGRTRYGC